MGEGQGGGEYTAESCLLQINADFCIQLKTHGLQLKRAYGLQLTAYCNLMKLFSLKREDFVSSHIKSIKGRLAKIDRDITDLSRFIANPVPRRRREEVSLGKLLGPSILPESKKRFVSYLSTGSFQTIGLRKHEQRAARIKAALIMLGIILVAFFLVYAFITPLFRYPK